MDRNLLRIRDIYTPLLLLLERLERFIEKDDIERKFVVKGSCAIFLSIFLTLRIIVLYSR